MNIFSHSRNGSSSHLFLYPVVILWDYCEGSSFMAVTKIARHQGWLGGLSL